MVKVTLRSYVTNMAVLSTPSVISWAGCAYLTAKNKAEKDRFVRIVVNGYHIPPEVVIDLFKQEIRWTIEDTNVVFYCEQARLWKLPVGSPHQFEIQSAEWLPE
jgi:hypothetical protein